MRRALKWVKRSLAALVLISCTVTTAVMTPQGQAALLRLVEYYGSASGKGIAFGPLEGSLFSQGRIARVALSDADGEWLVVRELRFAWSPLKLVTGTLDIERIIVGQVDVLRRPVAEGAQPEDDSGTSLVALAARRLEVNELVLHAPVIGQRAVLSVLGKADLADPMSGGLVTIEARRLDGPGGELSLRADYVAEQRLDVRLLASEPQGGLVARLLELPDAPPLSIDLSGAGPLDRWRAQWMLSASQQPFFGGSATLDRVGDRHELALRSEGYLARLVPVALTDVLAGKTTIVASGAWTGLRKLDAGKLSATSDTLLLEATGGFDLDDPYYHGEASATLVRADGSSLSLPLGSSEPISVASAAARISLPDNRQGRQASVSLGIARAAGGFGAVDEIRVSATARQQRPVGSSAWDTPDMALLATADGVAMADAAMGALVGPKLSAKLAGAREGDSFALSNIELKAAAGTLTGEARGTGVKANAIAELALAELSAFSGVAGREIAGTASIKADATFDGANGVVELALTGMGDGLRAGSPAADALLAGVTRLNAKGSAALDGTVTLASLTLANPQFGLEATGKSAGEALSFRARGRMDDTSVVSPVLAGAVNVEASLAGSKESLSSHIALTGAEMRVNGQTLQAPRISFDGAGTVDAHAGKVTLSGAIGGEEIAGDAHVALAGVGDISVEGLTVSVGSARLVGDLRLAAGSQPVGKLSLDIPKLATLAPFAGQPLDGSAKASLVMGAPGAAPVMIRASAPVIRAGPTRVTGVAASLDILDTAALRFNARATTKSIDSDGVKVRDLRIDARESESATQFQIAADMQGTPLSASGRLVQEGSKLVLTLSALQAPLGPSLVALDGPAKIVADDGVVLIERLVAKADAGRLQVSGRAGTEALDVSVVMQKLPARLAGAYDPALGLEGHLDGKVSIRGKPDAPIATADIKWLEAAAAATRAQYLPPLTLAMTAKLTDGVVKSEVTAGGVAGLDLKLTGQLDVEKKRTDMNVGGQIPMSLANAALADRNAQVSGTLRVAANVSGPLEAPQLQGELRVEAGSLSDPGSGLRLEGMTGSARFTRTSLTIERISASSAKGGSLNVAGTVSMPVEGPAVVEARVLLAELKFDDREMLAGEVDGDVNLRGALDALRATGAIRIKRLDITVPNQLPRSIAELDIQHVNASKTSYAARSQIETLHNNERQSFVTLDLDVQAANRIFVRGRGLDVQLGGALRLQGTSARPIANGGFVIERGRLDILGRQLDFKHGRLNFTGDLEPNLDMQASADADGVTISVLVTGPASKPKFRFSSVPALPEDEVVARLLFNKSLAKLSPVQLAQLAGEIDKIGGLSSGPSTLDQVKGALGVDVLDVGTNDNNGTEVSAGKYVGEGTYVGVRQGSSATSSRVVIDHDLTKNLKARGELGADGNSKIGVGVEWDY